MSIKVKLTHKLIRPLVKNLERLSLNKKIYLWKVIEFVLFARTLSEYKRLYKLKKVNVEELFEIDRQIGFSSFKVERNFTEKAISFGRQTLQEFLMQNFAKTNSKDYLQQIFNSSKLNQESEFLFTWATSAPVLKSVGKYLRKYPLLHDISVFYSPPENNQSDQYSGSQLFHMDGGGTQCVKIWLICEDIELRNGPTVLLPAELSQKIAKKIKYQPGTKILDEVVGDLSKEALLATGPAGTWFATDTDRCLHYGSRTKQSSGRLVLMFHYVDHNSTYYTPLLRHQYKHSINNIPKKIYSQKDYFSKMSIRFRLGNE